MCLWKTHDEPRIAQDDIEVWKVLTTKGLSPYQDYQYHPGMNKPACAKTVPVPVEQEYINGGYLHAYKTKEMAESHTKIRSYEKTVNLAGDVAFVQVYKEYVVQRMLIPKGSIYYEGDDDDICAERLYWPEEGAVHPSPIKFMEI